MATATRGCGKRKEGGAYAVLPTGPGGVPIEAFLVDIPHRPSEGLEISKIGVNVFPRGNDLVIIDWVGRGDSPDDEGYWNCADPVEEARRFGVSRRLPLNLPFDRITPTSRMLLVHARAYISNSTDVAPWTCPKVTLAQFYQSRGMERLLQGDALGAASDPAKGQKAMDEHHEVGRDPVCLGAVWSDVEGGRRIEDDGDPRMVARQMPSFTYMARRKPDDAKLDYQPAIFLSYPLRRIEVIKGEGADRTLEIVRRASGVEIAEMDE